MSPITLTVKNTPNGVTVDATGPLYGLTSQAWVARAMVDVASHLFVDSKPVLLAGEADPIKTLPVDEVEIDHCICECENGLTIQEIETLRCQDCGKEIFV
jgi:hypothetical protein